jgi:diacylglycerol O-acyltransferase / wax synthase
MPINERTASDTRANAITNVDITLDPAPATTDLRGIRAATKQALIRSKEAPNERWTLLPLVLLVPERLGKGWVSAATNSAASVGASNVGAVNPAVNRPDGTDADYFVMKSLSSRMTAAMMHQIGGLLLLLSGRAHGRVFVSLLRISRAVPTRMRTCDGTFRLL